DERGIGRGPRRAPRSAHRVRARRGDRTDHAAGAPPKVVRARFRLSERWRVREWQPDSRTPALRFRPLLARALDWYRVPLPKSRRLHRSSPEPRNPSPGDWRRSTFATRAVSWNRRTKGG